MNKDIEDAVFSSPIITAIKDDAGLEKSLSCESQVIFILYGDIVSLPEIVEKIKKAGKVAIVHMDLITGLSAKEIAVDFIHKNTAADGIISTKANLIQRGKALGLFTIHRFFMIDSMALNNMKKQLHNCKPDMIEILPALLPKIVTRICKSSPVPVITGGLISDKEDVLAMLNAGAVAISSTNPEVWEL